MHVWTLVWLSAGEALTSLSRMPIVVMSVAPRESHATSTLASNSSEGSFVQGPAEETSARGSPESPCRAFHPLNFPRDGHEPSAGATGSDDFPPKSGGTARSGIDEAMGPWLRPQVGDTLLLAQQTVHMNPGCFLISRRTYPLKMCYCVNKLHRCFHY